MDQEEIVFNIISHAGSARSASFEALREAREGNLEQAEKQLELAKAELLDAHHIQTRILQQEALGNKQEVSLLLVHAEDHLMTAMLINDLASELIEMYKSGFGKNKENIG